MRGGELTGHIMKLTKWPTREISRCAEATVAPAKTSG
jgi:hypothetical protein